ncbi:hypothetical protein C2845_PM06G27800 [Panicum miliaceum]|uniref:Uncharacterized protein n=1 Tax=Panicum miliaceum TaxID=4540 RepID=A0A3L6REF5_PANMI|nr:hypothetical protein C2845_PM06G27800 [Panicum miliaceum]
MYISSFILFFFFPSAPPPPLPLPPAKLAGRLRPRSLAPGRVGSRWPPAPPVRGAAAASSSPAAATSPRRARPLLRAPALSRRRELPRAWPPPREGPPPVRPPSPRVDHLRPRTSAVRSSGRLRLQQIDCLRPAPPKSAPELASASPAPSTRFQSCCPKRRSGDVFKVGLGWSARFGGFSTRIEGEFPSQMDLILLQLQPNVFDPPSKHMLSSGW